MTNEQIILLTIKGAIAELPPAKQDDVFAALAGLRATVAAYPDGAGELALVLLSAELAAK